MDVEQVIANCPKYITARESSPGPVGVPYVSRGEALTPAQVRAVTLADAFFVTTADAYGDADTSHRGGDPRFLRVLSPTTLRWPDYRGNTMFLTLGNLAVNPAAGLLVPDWDTGTTLQLTGTATIEWTGTEREIAFAIEAVHESAGAMPLRWSAPEYSRFNPPAT